MKTKVLYSIAFLSCLVLGLIGYKYRHYLAELIKTPLTNRLLTSNESVVAVFSFNQGDGYLLDTTIKHRKIILTDLDELSIDHELSQLTAQDGPLMITVETWGSDLLSRYNRNPLSQVIKGDFDPLIIQLCQRLTDYRAKVYLRFNPEMDVPAYTYPWQKSLLNYLKAYRHFAQLCKKYAPKAILMWAPAGYPGAMEFYPGDDVVAATSITVKCNSENGLNVYPIDYSIQYDIQRRLHRLRFVNKPIFVFAAKSMKAAIDKKLVDSISTQIRQEKKIVYSDENFIRPSASNVINTENPILGLYDPQSLLVEEPAVSAEHLFVDFGSLHDGSFKADFRNVLARKHALIITFEPFRYPNRKADRNVLANVSAGLYDHEISAFYDIICSTNQRIYLRYAHEMEIPILRYPWQSHDPVEYIHSFRYFMQFRDTLTDHIQRIWGPAGDRGSIEWYPGNDIVDVLSIAIYGLPDKNITDPEKQESFATIFNRKYWRLRFIDKPLFITEFGVKGPEEYQTNWLLAAAKVIRQNNQIIGINYFNMSDKPKAWGEIKPPDWSISKASFDIFTTQLKRK
jgi:beta-mannanase